MNILKVGFGAAMLVGLGSPAFAQTNQASTTGSTTIVRPVTITKNADLVFGRVVRPSTGTGTVTLTTTSDTPTIDNGLILGGITTSHANYTINGEGGQAVSITIPASFTMSGPSASSLVVTLTKDVTGSETLSNALGAAGSKTVNIGGSFPLTATTTTGAYTGTFNVDVAYE